MSIYKSWQPGGLTWTSSRLKSKDTPRSKQDGPISPAVVFDSTSIPEFVGSGCFEALNLVQWRWGFQCMISRECD